VFHKTWASTLRATMDRTDLLELSREFGNLAGQIAGAGGGAAPADRVVELAVKSVEGCRYATISTVRGRHSQLLASSDAPGQQLEQLQNEFSEGPTLDVARLEENQSANDLLRDARWPQFAPAAVRATGIGSLLAVKLAGAHPSVLTMYACEPAGFSAEAQDTAAIFVGYASSLVALLAATEQAGNLQTALSSSREIGMALGILMAHRKITGDVAFDLLRTTSQNLHRKLRDVAGEVMETGALPELPSRRPTER